MINKQLIIDHCIQSFLGDRILEPEYAEKFPGATVLSCLTSQARQQGWEVHTADVFLSKVKSFDKAVCISNESTPLFNRLVDRGVIPGLLISGESPNIARQFYLDLPQESIPFAHASVFRGSLKRLSENCKGHVFLWPCPSRVLETDIAWKLRGILGMVASYKSAWGGLRDFPSQIIPRLSWEYSKFNEQTLKLKDIYPLRIKLAEKFGPKEGFYLYGNYWAKILKLEPRFWRKRFKFANKPYSCSDKLLALGGCRYSLIMENCIYPGYVTEKIFDAFRAGCVPVYLGAPDIEDFVPRECFIDYRAFKSPDSMWEELISIPESTWEQYRHSIFQFLKSSKYFSHLEKNVAQKWLGLLEESSS